MRRRISRTIAKVLVMFLVVTSFGAVNTPIISSAEDNNIKLGDTDFLNVPHSGNIIIEVPGSSRMQNIKEAVDRINEIRHEACEEGLAKPNTNNEKHSDEEFLKEGDLPDISYSYALSVLAYIRASEASLLKGHIRPNSYNKSQKASQMYPINGSQIWLENIAYYLRSTDADGNENTLLTAVNNWYEEKQDYIDNNYDDGSGTGVKYGHYQTMINPDIVCVGFGLFTNHDTDCTEVITGEFGNVQGSQDLEYVNGGYIYGTDADYNQKVEIGANYIDELGISGPDYLVQGSENDLKAVVKTSLNNNYEATVYNGVKWTSSNTDVAVIDEESEKIIAVGPGETVVSVSVIGCESINCSMKITVLPDTVRVKEIIQPSSITVESCVEPVLPERVSATLTTGEEIKIQVEWEEYDKTQLVTYFTGRDFSIYGTAMGKDVIQNIHVKELSDVKGTAGTIYTDSGVQPVYPKASVTVGKENYSEVPVIWDQNDKAANYYKTREGGTFKIYGKTAVPLPQNEYGQIIPVEATLIVRPSYVKNVELKQNSIETISGHEPEYPKAEVTWSNGDVTEEDIKWNETEAYINGYFSEEYSSYEITGNFFDDINDRIIDTELTATVNVIPKIATNISVTDFPQQKINKELDVSEVNIAVTYNDGSKEVYPLDELLGDSVTISNYKNSNEGNQQLLIQYENKVYKSPYKQYIYTGANVIVKSKFVDRIEIESEPDKTTYVEGSELDVSGGSIHVYYDNGDDEIIAIKEDMISGYDKLKVGQKTITVTLDNKTASFIVTVKERKIDKIFVVAPSKTKYIAGQAIALGDSYIHIDFDDGTNKNVELSDSEVIVNVMSTQTANIMDEEDLKSLGSGQYKVMVIYNGKLLETENSEEIVISVKDMQKDATAKPPENIGEGLTSKSTDSDIKNAMNGTTISVPCEGGNVDYVISADSVSGISEVSADEVPEESRVEGDDIVYKKIDIKVAESSDGSPICVSVYMPVTKDKSSEEGGSDKDDLSDGGSSSGKDSSGGESSDGKDSSDSGSSSDKTTPGNNEQPNTNGSSDQQPSNTPAVGKTVTVGSAKVKVLGSSAVSYSGPTSKIIKTASIPATVKIGGKTYKVTTIGAGAFSGCTKLTSVKIGKNVNTIGKKAFYNCKKLTKVTIGANVTSIGVSAFEKCTSLKSVVIPKKVKKIGKRAFYGCKKLKKITIKTSKLSKKSIGAKAFKGIYSKATVKVPAKKLKTYKKYLWKAGVSKKAKIKK